MGGEYAMTTDVLTCANLAAKQDAIAKYKNAHALRYDNVTRGLLRAGQSRRSSRHDRPVPPPA
jgi:hypothetical protein